METAVAKQQGEILQLNADKISRLTGMTSDEVAVIKATVAKGTSDTELAYFLSVCKSNELNPFMKEIWCYKDNRGNLLVFAGRDGFRKRAQQSQLWNGLASCEVCENDTFSMNTATGEVSHTSNFKNRGKIIGAYAVSKPKGTEYATVAWADFGTYNKGKFTWETHPAEMIKKVAEIHCLKAAYGITVIQSEYEFDVRNNVAIPIGTPEKSEIETAEKKIIDALDSYTGEDKDYLKEMCVEKKKAGEFDMTFARQIAKTLGIEL